MYLSYCDYSYLLLLSVISLYHRKRRAEITGLKRMKYPLLQIDQLVLFLMDPGRFQEPDNRCMVRLMMAIRQEDNPFYHMFPLPVKTIIHTIKDNTYHHAVLAWWNYNGRTQFFSHAKQVRRVRYVIKKGLAGV